jgi:hypothetical protein
VTQPKPPLPWLLAYRVLGLRLPEQYRPWVAEDVARKPFLTWRIGRTIVWEAAFLALYVLGQTTMFQRPHPLTVRRLIYGLLILALLASGNTLVRRTLRWQRIDKHGHPVAPKGLAVLENHEAALLAVALLVAFTGAAGVFGYALRPTGVSVAPCRGPDAETLAAIRAGLKNDATVIKNPQAISYANGKIVAAVVEQPGKKALFTAWIVEGGKVFELRQPAQKKESPTTFDPPVRADRVAVDALQRAATCLSTKTLR